MQVNLHRRVVSTPVAGQLPRSRARLQQAMGSITDKGWFAARQSGTEDVYKIYAESFCSRSHLHKIEQDAQALIAELFKKSREPV